MRKIVIILSVLVFVANVYGQAKIELREISSGKFISIDIDNIFPLPYNITIRVTPDKSAVIDTIKRANIQQIVGKINTMQLKCDTIINEHSELKIIYLDKENRLRKYFLMVLGESGASKIVAYYNEKGNLIYIAFDSYSNADDKSEYFYVHNGRIIDFMGAYDCEWCETDDDLMEYEKETINRPILGNVLTKSITVRWKSFANFIYADKLLKILQSKEYVGDTEFENYDE